MTTWFSGWGSRSSDTDNQVPISAADAVKPNPDAWESAKALGWKTLEKTQEVAVYVLTFAQRGMKEFRQDIEEVQRVYTHVTNGDAVTLHDFREGLKRLKAVVLKTLVLSIALTFVAYKVLNLVRGLPIIGSIARAAQLTNLVGLGVLMVELPTVAFAIGQGRYAVYQLISSGTGADQPVRERWVAQVVDRMVEVYEDRSLLLASLSSTVGGALDEIRSVAHQGSHVDTPNLNKFRGVVSVIDAVSGWFSVAREYVKVGKDD